MVCRLSRVGLLWRFGSNCRLTVKSSQLRNDYDISFCQKGSYTDRVQYPKVCTGMVKDMECITVYSLYNS